MNRDEYERWHDAHFQRGNILRALVAVLLFCAAFAIAWSAWAEIVSAPDREKLGQEQYCSVWANVALYGVGKWMRVPEDMHNKSLVFVRQTSAEDKADPENRDVLMIDGEAHPVIISVLDGVYDDGETWQLDESAIKWSESAMQAGWKWAQTHGAPNDAQHAVFMLRLECMKGARQMSASSERFIRRCEAATIAEFSYRMDEAQWVEVIKNERQIGRIDAEHAQRLIDLIREVYKVEDRNAWARARCKEEQT